MPRPTFGELGDRVQGLLPRPMAAVVERLRQEDVVLLSAGLAFYALVSVVPFTIVVLWAVSVSTGDQRVHEMGKQLAEVLPSNLGVDRAFERVADLGPRLGIGAIVALLWPATAYGSGLRRAFTKLVPGDEEEPKGLHGRALALALLGVVPGLVVAGLVAAIVATSIFGAGGFAQVAGWATALVFGFMASWVTIGLIYWLFSPRPMPWRSLARGAATAAGAVSLLSLAFVLFLNLGLDFQRRYATSGLAAVVLLAFWLFLANGFILVGYEIARER